MQRNFDMFLEAFRVVDCAISNLEQSSYKKVWVSFWFHYQKVSHQWISINIEKEFDKYLESLKRFDIPALEIMFCFNDLLRVTFKF